jgi:hypothetical protein
MLTLREMLSRGIDGNSQSIPVVYPSVKISRITKEIERRYSRAGNSPTPADLAQLQEIFLSAVESRAWDNISQRMWKRACWILWSGDNPLALNITFLNKYIEYCKTHASTKLIKSIIHVYLRDFKNGMSANYEITSLILEQLNEPRFKNLLAFWKERHELYLIFDTTNNFHLNAKFYLKSKDRANEYLKKMGLDDQLEISNYSQELFRAVAFEVEKNIAESTLPSEMFNKLKDLAIKNKKLRYPQNKTLIESLLRPWLRKSPPSELCKQILQFLLKHFNDPRTAEGRNSWISINEDALRVVKKWLAGATLEQFFEIIDNTAQDDHWRYRRKFWQAYYDAECIDDAWIALGKDSELEARTQSVYGNELIAAKLRGSGVKPDHSVLIFKLQGLIICEWSHQGKCRIWNERNKKSPRLYEKEYLAKYLREHENFSQPHQSSETYAWQHKIAEHIKDKTGIKMPSYKYEIK